MTVSNKVYFCEKNTEEVIFAFCEFKINKCVENYSK